MELAVTGCRFGYLLANILAVFLLAACGGGSGGSGNSTPPFNWSATQEYRNQPGLELVKAYAVYTQGASGEDIVVAVIDTGLNRSHREFAGRIHAATYDIVNNTSNVNDSDDGHGTAVAGVIGAAYDGRGMQGVAPNSIIMGIATDNLFGSFDFSDTANAIRYAVDNGAQVINMSLGGTGSTPAVIVSALQYAADNGVAVVIATGNDGNSSSTNTPASEAGKSRYNGLVVAVGSVDGNGTISDFSSRCPRGREAFCIVAPGRNIYTTGAIGSSYITTSGTSFATPHVAGAIALLLDLFPTLNAKQAIEILLATATDRTSAATHSLYGNGLLNLAAASQPLGTMTTTESPGSAAIASSSLSMGSAFGTALRNNAVLSNAIGFDRYQRAYKVDLTNNILTPGFQTKLTGFTDPNTRHSDTIRHGNFQTSISYSQTAQNDDRLDEDVFEDLTFSATLDMAGDRSLDLNYGSYGGVAAHKDIAAAASLFQITDSPIAPILSLLDDPVSFEFGQQRGQWDMRYGGTYGTVEGADGFDVFAGLQRNFDNGLSIGATAHATQETGSFLGSTAAAGFDSGFSATTISMDIGLSYSREEVTYFAQATRAFSDVDDNGAGIITDVNGLRSDAVVFGFVADKVLSPRDRLGLIISRPLRVTEGSGKINENAARFQDSSSNQAREVNLASVGTQTNIELAYQNRISSTESLSFGMALIMDPGHDATASTEFAAGIRYMLQF